MKGYLSIRETSYKWGVSERRVNQYVTEGRIPGVERFGRSWAIPADARGLAPEQIIVLTSAFETDGTSREDGLEPNKTYEDYRWILTRETSSAPFWEITGQG